MRHKLTHIVRYASSAVDDLLVDHHRSGELDLNPVADSRTRRPFPQSLFEAMR